MTQPVQPNFYAGSVVVGDDLQGVVGGPRTPYTPTLTNITLGTTGASRAGWYRWTNQGTIMIAAKFVLGVGGSAGGTIEIGLPSGVTLDTTVEQLGKTVATDASPFQRYSGSVIMSATTFSRMIYGATAQVGANATYPFTFAVNDAMIVGGEFAVI